jgi:hypothetical protein
MCFDGAVLTEKYLALIDSSYPSRKSLMKPYGSYFYGSAAPGENMVYTAEENYCVSMDTVIEFTRHSDEIMNGGFWEQFRGSFNSESIQ